MIEVEGLSKIFVRRKKFFRYERFYALDSISFYIREGEKVGLIGPNGAGKTTLIKILSRLLLPDNGRIKIKGYELNGCKEGIYAEIGVLFGNNPRSLYWRLSGYENLYFFASLNCIPRKKEKILEVAEIVGLREELSEPVMNYSTGMKQRLSLAIVLLKDPKIYLLDEPLGGVDPKTAYQIKQILQSIIQKKTVIWTSHNLYGVEEMCDRIILINRGRIVYDGTAYGIRERFNKREKYVKIIGSNIDSLMDIKGATKMNTETILIKTEEVESLLKELTSRIDSCHLHIKDISITSPSLEEVFIEVIKKESY